MSLTSSSPEAVQIVRGQPDDVEVAALIAGLAAVAGPDAWDDVAPIPAWTDRARGLAARNAGVRAPAFGRRPDTGQGAQFDGRSGRHNHDAWRWSLRG